MLSKHPTAQERTASDAAGDESIDDRPETEGLIDDPSAGNAIDDQSSATDEWTGQTRKRIDPTNSTDPTTRTHRCGSNVTFRGP